MPSKLTCWPVLSLICLTLVPAALAQQIDGEAVSLDLGQSSASSELGALELGTGFASEARSLGQFPRDVAGSFQRLFLPENMTPLLLGMGLAGFAGGVDDDVHEFASATQRVEEMGAVGDFMGDRFVVAGAVGGLFLTSRMVGNDRFQSMAYDIAQGYIINSGMTIAFKHAAPRVRPDGDNDLSFPSGHTSTAFMWATVLNRHYGRRVGIPAYAAATFIGLSRVEKNKHFLSDVVAGATLGYIVGKTVTKRHGQSEGSRFEYSVAPTFTDGGGVALTVSYSF